MVTEDRNFLRDFFRQVSDKPLDPTDTRYIPLYTPELADQDPVELLASAIEWTQTESVQLLSGFRGTGKSTELKRLKKRLEGDGYIVFLCDAEDYLNLSTPVDVTDFLLAIAGAFSDAIAQPEFLGADPSYESYWTRFESFLTKTKVELNTVSFGTGGANIQANLKSDPTFKQRLQERLSGHLGVLVNDVRAFFQENVKSLKQQLGNDHEVVLLVDSLEHIRGTFVNALDVQSSVERLFATHADKLKLPYVHVVYTVPPYLKVRFGNLGSLYEPGGLLVLPAFKLHDKGGTKVQAGFGAMERVVSARGDWRRLLGERALLDQLIQHSGGQLRDLLRLLAETMRRATNLPVSQNTVTSAIGQIRAEFLPIADEDALWLSEIAKVHDVALKNVERLPDLARFFDTHLALCYRNGDEWYDVHPLIQDHVRDQAERARLRHDRSQE